MSKDADASEDLGASFRQSRKEFFFMLAAWVVFLVWTIGYNATHAFDSATSGENLIFGMPRWIFFGILLPWVCGVILTIWFAGFFMKDTDLAAAPGDEPEPETGE